MIAISLILSCISLVGIFFIMGELRTGDGFIGHKPKLNALPKKPGLPDPVVEDGIVRFAFNHPVLIPQVDSEGGGSLQSLSTEYNIRVPDGYFAIVSLDYDVFDVDGVFIKDRVLKPGWSGELMVMLGNRHMTEPVVLDAGVHCLSLYLIRRPVGCNLNRI